MLTKIMMWVSIAVVLLALLELPVTSEPVLVEFVVCATGLLVICQAVRAGQYTSLRPDSCFSSLPVLVDRHPERDGGSRRSEWVLSLRRLRDSNEQCAEGKTRGKDEVAVNPQIPPCLADR